MEELFPGKKDVPTFLALLVLQSLSCGKTGYYFSWQSAKLKKCGTSNFNTGVNGKSLKLKMADCRAKRMKIGDPWA